MPFAIRDGKLMLAIAGQVVGRFCDLQAADRDDARQEAVLRMLEKVGKVDSERSAGEQVNYAKRVAYSGVISYLRSTRRVHVCRADGDAEVRLYRPKMRSDDLGEQRVARCRLDSDATPEEMLRASELGKLLEKVLALSFSRLTPLQQDVFKACLYDESLPERWRAVNSAAFSWHAEQVRAAIRVAAVEVGVEAEIDLRAKSIFVKSKCRVATCAG